MLVLLLTVIKMFGRLFRFEYGFVHTDFIELFTVHLLEKKSRCYHLLKPRYMQNKKSSKHDHQAGKQHCHVAFDFEYGRNIRTSQQKFVYAILVELFTAHLLKEKPRFYHFVKPRYMRHKECRNIFVTPGTSLRGCSTCEYKRNNVKVKTRLFVIYT